MGMIQKQTVYLPVEDYLERQWNEPFEDIVNAKEGYFFTPEQLNEYTQGVIKQALETAAENAVTKDEWWGNTGSEYCDTVVDWQSITNTFEETFQLFCVK